MRPADLLNLGEYLDMGRDMVTVLHLHRRKEVTVLFDPNKRGKLCGTRNCKWLSVKSIESIGDMYVGRRKLSGSN